MLKPQNQYIKLSEYSDGHIILEILFDKFKLFVFSKQ